MQQYFTIDMLRGYRESVIGSISAIEAGMLGGIGMTEQELRRTYDMFTAAWKFFRKYSDIQQTDNARWEQLVEESGQIAKAYGNCKLVRGLLLAAVDELEQRSKEERKSAESQ